MSIHRGAQAVLLMLLAWCLSLSACAGPKSACGLSTDPGLTRQERLLLSDCEIQCVRSSEGDCSHSCWKQLVADRMVAYLSQESRSPTLVAQPDWQTNQLQVHLGWTLVLPEGLSSAEDESLKTAFEDIVLRVHRVVERDVIDESQFLSALAATNHGTSQSDLAKLIKPGTGRRPQKTVTLAIRPGQAKEEDGGAIRAAIGQQSALYEDEIIDLDGFSALSRARTPIAAYVLVGVVEKSAQGDISVRLHFGVRHELVFTSQRNEEGQLVQGVPVTTDRMSPDRTSDIFCKQPCQAQNTGGGAPKLILHPWTDINEAPIDHSSPNSSSEDIYTVSTESMQPRQAKPPAGRVFYHDDESSIVRASSKFLEPQRDSPPEPLTLPCPFSEVELDVQLNDLSWPDAKALCTQEKLQLPSAEQARTLASCTLEDGLYWTGIQKTDPSHYSVDGKLYEIFEVRGQNIELMEEDLWSRARNALCLPKQ